MSSLFGDENCTLFLHDSRSMTRAERATEDAYDNLKSYLLTSCPVSLGVKLLQTLPKLDLLTKTQNQMKMEVIKLNCHILDTD